MASNRFLAVAAGVGFVFGCSGWIVAWKNGNERDALARDQGVESQTRKTKSGNRRDSRAERPSTLISDAKSLQLHKAIQEMKEGEVSGEPNKKLLKAMDNLMLDANFERRQRDFGLLLDQMRPEDAQAVHDTFVKLERSGRPFGEEYAAFAVRWGQVDGAGAMAFWAAREPFDMKAHDFNNVIRGWCLTAPEKALEWIDQHDSLVGQWNPRCAVTKGWFQKDPVEATAWLQRQDLPERQLGECITGAMIDRLYAGGPEHAAEWLASLQDQGTLAAAALQGWNDSQYRLANLSLEDAASIWEKVGGQPWMGMEQFDRFCASVTRANGGDREGVLEAISNRWPAAQVSSQFEQWAARDPARVGNWILNSNESSMRDAAITGMMRSLQQNEPEAADRWLQKFGK